MCMVPDYKGTSVGGNTRLGKEGWKIRGHQYEEANLQSGYEGEMEPRLQLREAQEDQDQGMLVTRLKLSILFCLLHIDCPWNQIIVEQNSLRIYSPCRDVVAVFDANADLPLASVRRWKISSSLCSL
jgi:hypothetical protein